MRHGMVEKDRVTLAGKYEHQEEFPILNNVQFKNTLSGDSPECTGLWLLFIEADVYFTKIFIPTKELYVM